MSLAHESPATSHEATDAERARLAAGLPPSVSAYRFLARSSHPVARHARSLAQGLEHVSLPLPAWVMRLMLTSFLAGREAFHFCYRVLVCEPLFKAYCTAYGRRVHTGVYVHFVEGRGSLIVGDDVKIDGKCTFSFARRMDGLPTLKIGAGTMIGHGCSFVVARYVEVGAKCLLAIGVHILDSPGHSNDLERRLRGLPPLEDEVRPVTIADGVWIGMDSIILPGVSIGAGSIVAAGSVVTGNVPPMTLVAGYPARKIADLRPSSAIRSGASEG